MAEITMQELMEKEISDETILRTADGYVIAFTAKKVHDVMWYHLYVRTGIPGKYNIELIRVYHVKDNAIAAFNALTV